VAKTGLCDFCGAHGALDREHYVARRFRKYFANKTETSYGLLQTYYDPASRTYKTRRRRATQSPWAVPVGGIGKNCCNNSWMRELDDAVEPLLVVALGVETMILKDRHLRLLSAWAEKVAALHELTAYPADRSAIPIEHRRHLRKHRRPPPGTKVWITAWQWNGSLPSIDQTTLRLSYDRLADPASPRKNAHVTTVSFGRLAIHLHGCAGIENRVVTPNRRLDDSLIPSWPRPPRTATWPRGQVLAPRDVSILSTSILSTLIHVS